MAGDPAVSQYGPDEGLPALRDALRKKIADENGLTGVRWAAADDAGGEAPQQWRAGQLLLGPRAHGHRLL